MATEDSHSTAIESPSKPPGSRISRFITLGAVAMLVTHGALLIRVSCVNSPNIDEPAHLASGISHWRFGRFELYRVNPPLVRMVAAVPILMTDAKADWSEWSFDSPYSRAEFPTGTRFVTLNGETVFWYFTLARLACIPLCLVGVWIVFLWAAELYGPIAGLIAMSLYCFCPNCIAWGASITPDAVGASFGVMAAYLFWRWLGNPRLGNAIVAGIGLGLAELSKGTWVVLFVIWPIIWVVHCLASPKRRDSANSQCAPGVSAQRVNCLPTLTRPTFRQLMVILLLAVYMLNLGFGFEGSFKPLREYRFVSKSLSGQEQPAAGANRFSESWLGALPVPLPENYVRGLDVQKYDFERGKWSYLCGEQRRSGWWYYYLFAFLVKTPVCTLILFVVATVLFLIRSRFRSDWRDEWMLLLPPIAILILVSSQTGFSRYLRYALPVLPFVFVHVSRIAIAILYGNRLVWIFVAACCLGTAIESLAVFPHSMSFFNRAAGGPLNGHAYLLDANIDWGQDLLFLKRWYDDHPQARPFHLAYFGDFHVNPEFAAINFQPVPGFLASEHRSKETDELTGPQPGWFAVSINHVKGYRHLESDEPKYAYFQRLHPVDSVGYSINVYHLTLSEANDLRHELGLESLTTEP